MRRRVGVLVVDESDARAGCVQQALQQAGYDATCRRVDPAPGVAEAIRQEPWDIVICYGDLPRGDLSAVLCAVQAHAPDLPTVVVADGGSVEAAVHAIKAGAYDYITSADPRRLAPAVERALGEAADRRARRQEERRRRKAKTLECLGNLAGRIAHDFNNALTAIRGYTQLAAMHLSPDHPAHRSVAQIQMAVSSAAEFTRQLLVVSGRRQSDTTRVNLNHLVRRLEPVLRSFADNGVGLSVRLADDLGDVTMPLDQAEQVILTLAANAREAMPQGGRLSIETANVDVHQPQDSETAEVPPGAYVRLSVSDTGVGMSEDVKERLFEPFFSTKEHKRKGGLSLAMVYGIAKQSGAHILVHSGPGAGATFDLYFPRVAEPSTTLPLRVRGGSSSSESAAEGTETILLAEDDADVRELVAAVLLQHGYTVIEARDGLEALALAQEQPDRQIHLLLTDIIMPGMDGKELADRLVVMRPGIKVLFTSGQSSEMLAKHGVVNPQAPFLPKPFSPQELAYKVREVLDSDPPQGRM